MHETPARERYAPVDRVMVAEVVKTVLTTMSGDLSVTETSLLGEVEALGRTIAAAKQEIAALRADDIAERDIPFATDELDAIVEHTAGATHAILESCEMLDDVASKVSGEAAAGVQEAVTRIYEACGFQDITGQRITKVVTTLQAIESKVAQIIRTFGLAAGPKPPANAGLNSPVLNSPASSEANLLNGPQLSANAMDQSGIDKLLASFG